MGGGDVCVKSFCTIIDESFRWSIDKSVEEMEIKYLEYLLVILVLVTVFQCFLDL